MPIITQIFGTFRKEYETEQFNSIAQIIQKNSNSLGNGFLLGNINTNSSELDALLITTKIVLGIEFKHYPKDSNILIESNSWKVRDSKKNPIKDK